MIEADLEDADASENDMATSATRARTACGGLADDVVANIWADLDQLEVR